MSRWIKDFPVPLIYITFILVWLYFAIHKGVAFIWLISLLLILRLCSVYKGRGRWISLALLASFSGFFFLNREISNKQALQEDSPVQQILVLPDTVKINGDLLSFRGKSKGKSYQAYYKLKSLAEKEAFQELSDLVILRVEGSLGLPEGQRNFSGFDYQAYLKTQGIYRVLQIDNVLSSQPAVSFNPLEHLSAWRRKAIVSIKKNFPQPMNNYMTGLLLGYLDRDFQEMNDLYSSLGIIHLFALSGMQVGFFMDGFRKLLLRLGLKQETVDKLQYPFSFFYAGMTGFSVSVVRSLIQKLLARQGFGKLDNFALTILLLFVLMPNFLLTTGGVLSCAYAFILTLTDFEGLTPWRRIIAESASISLGILPILMFYFAEFQPWSILLTFAFSFLFDMLLLPGLTLIFFLSPFLKITQVNGFFQLLENVIRFLDSWASRPLILGQPSLFVLCLILILLALLYDFRKKKSYVCFLSLILLCLFIQSKHPLENEITMLDVGQGRSIFMRDWRGKTVLIDLGSKVAIRKKEAWQERQFTSKAERTLIPYLKSRGVARIDSLILTQTDDIGDLQEVARQFKIEQVYVSKGSFKQTNLVESLKGLEKQVHIVQAGDKIPIFDSYLQVLVPNGGSGGESDDSFVLYGNLLHTKFLFTGDLQIEKDIIQHYPDLQVDVLKTGPQTLSNLAFLKTINPKILLVSAEKNKGYQQQKTKNLEDLDQVQAHLYTTENNGAIRFKGWRKWKIETVK